jgi:hypothetical protein
MDTVLNYDEVLVKISAIIEVRNCITHCAGKVTTSRTSSRLENYNIFCNVGETIHFKNNILDDFLHYMAIHVLGFLKALP